MRRVFLLLALISSTAAAGQSVFHGSLHAHTSYSDGSGTPDDAFTMGRVNGMDFMAITEHNHRAADGKGPRHDNLLIGKQPQLYSGTSTSLVEAANRHNKPGQFVTIYGQEVSTISQGNHINIFGVNAVVDDTVVPNGNVPALLTWMAAHPDSTGQPALLQFNHPRDPDRNLKDYGRDDFPAANWVRTLDPFVELIEILNAPALKNGTGFRADAKEGYYLEYLNLGFHAGPSVGHDNHWKNWGTSTDARLGVIASALTRDAIMAALRARHTFASDDRNISVIFRSSEAIGGDIIPAPAPGTTLPLTVQIADPDEPSARYRVDVLSDHPGGERVRRPVESFRIEGNTNGRFPLDGVVADGPGQFVMLRVTQTGPEEGDAEHEETEDRTWTAPIWFESSVQPAFATAAVQIVDLLPNPASDDAVNEEVRLRNSGGTPVDISGWQLRDLAGNVWILGGTIAPGQTVTGKRNHQVMSLNNDGDVIELITAAGTVVDTVRYGNAAEGARMSPVR